VNRRPFRAAIAGLLALLAAGCGESPRPPAGGTDTRPPPVPRDDRVRADIETLVAREGTFAREDHLARGGGAGEVGAEMDFAGARLSIDLAADGEVAARVGEVAAGSAAARVGLQAGDLVVGVDGAAASPDRLRSAAEALESDKNTTLTIERKGRRLVLPTPPGGD
jgi:S1-C subfamily serine protease